MKLVSSGSLPRLRSTICGYRGASLGRDISWRQPVSSRGVTSTFKSPIAATCTFARDRRHYSSAARPTPMATARKVQLSVANAGVFSSGPREDTARTASQLLQDDLEKHHVFFNAEGFHSKSCRSEKHFT